MISKTIHRNKKMFILKNLGTKKALDYTHICHIFKLKSLNGMPKYNVKMFFFTTPLLIHGEKYCLQVYYVKAI